MKKIRVFVLITIIAILSVGVTVMADENKWDFSKVTTVGDGVVKVEEILNTNYEKKNVNDIKIPILMYHVVEDNPGPNNLTITTDQLREEVKWLKEEGYTPMTMTEVLASFKSGVVPKKPIALTFDDGEKNNYTKAFPILKEFDVKATFFVITSGVGNGYYMDLDMLKEMKDYGMDIQSHTQGHRELNKIPKQEKIKEIQGAKDYLKDNLGVNNNILCYPVGRFDNETEEVASSLGIELAVTTKGGIAKIQDGMLSMPRRRVSPMPLEAYKRMVQIQQ